MPVPHPAAVIGQQLANGHPSAPAWRERAAASPAPRTRRPASVGAVVAVLPRLAHTVSRAWAARHAARA